MAVRMSERHVFGADFETDNDGIRAWIVQFSISDGEKEIWGDSLEGFSSQMMYLVCKYVKIYVYFHNAKYDMEFTKSMLADWQDRGWVLNIIQRKGAFIKIKATSGDYVIEFRDSMKKIPADLKTVGQMIGLPKQESPYPFFPGWSKNLDLSHDSADYCYCRIDSRIVALAMRDYHKQGFTRATMSGDAWACAQRMIGGRGRSYKTYPLWEKYFPRLSLELDNLLRPAYFGGINYSACKGINSGGISHYDIHNSYGAVMMYRPMPYGLPIETDVLPRGSMLFIAKIRVKLTLREGLRPWFQFKNGIDNIVEGWDHGTLVEATQFYHTLTLSSVDIRILNNWYQMDYDPDYKPTYWAFRSKIGLLKPYIDQYTAIKESSPKGSLAYERAKKMINMVYGRSGLNVSKDVITLDWSDDLQDYDWTVTALDDEDDNDSYVPYAIFATAWARKALLDNCLEIIRQYGPDSLIHCDTDSAIYKGGPCEGIAYGEHLGTWGLESEPEYVIEAGFKRYIELRQYPMTSIDDLIGMACAGVPQRWDYDHNYPVGMWVELLDEPSIMLIDGYVLGQEHYWIKSGWLRELYRKYGTDPDDVDTRKLIPVKAPGGWILEGRQHHLNDNLYWRLRR